MENFLYKLYKNNWKQASQKIDSETYKGVKCTNRIKAAEREMAAIMPDIQRENDLLE